MRLIHRDQAAQLSGASNLLRFRDSITGAIEARKGIAIELNAADRYAND